MLDLYEATLETQWLRWALALQQTIDTQFWDEKGGYFDAHASPDVILRYELRPLHW